MKKSILFTLPILLATSMPANAIVVRHDKQVNQYLANPDDYKSVFILYRGTTGAPICAATLISESWALTAGHCVSRSMFKEALREIRGMEVEVGGKRRFIDKAVSHPAWIKKQGPKRPDLALVHFKDPITDIKPTPLYKANDEESKVVSILGWGGTGTGITGVEVEDRTFRMAQNRVTEALNHTLTWKFDDPRINDGRALEFEGVSGLGDSGGPAFIETPAGLAIAGVSSGQDSYGFERRHYGVVEYYVRVSSSIDWIEETISK